MTALDILILILLGGGALLGFVRGFVQEVFSLLAWVAAILAVKVGFDPVAALLANAIENDSARLVAAFALCFLPVLLIVRLLALKLGGKARRSLIGPVDRLLGGLFGMLKGLLIATVLYLIANFATDIIYGPEAPRPDWMREARTYPLLNASARATVDMIETQREEGRL